MMKLQQYLARLIVPVLLFQALNTQAQTRLQSSTATPSAINKTTPCDDLLKPTNLALQTKGVQKRLNQHRKLVKGQQCVILSANPLKDLSELIEQFPENTVILFSSNTDPIVTPSPTATSLTGKTPVVYFADHEIHLKNGQNIIGAADDGFEIVIRDRPVFEGKYLLRFGSANFQPAHTDDSNIKHITFRPTRKKKRDSIKSIIYAECYNRKLIVEKNVFYPPVLAEIIDVNDLHKPPFRAAVIIACEKNLDASVKWLQGPELQFADNRIIGEKFDSISDKLFPYVIPDQGLFINLTGIMNQQDKIAVSGNIFEGYIAEAAEFTLGPGTRMEVFNNTISISNEGDTEHNSVRKGGFVLAGPADNTEIPPVFLLADNQIRVTRTAIIVRGQLGLIMACNHLQAVNPWWQPQKQFSLKALPLPSGREPEWCNDIVSSTTVRPTSSGSAHDRSTSIPPAISSRFANTWTAINGSFFTACKGLVNFEGRFLFATEVCQPVISHSAPGTSTTAVPPSSTITATVATPLGIMTTLAILLNL
ncbi:hypothetical protein [Endozoicomonas sp. ALB032]|uniref:hypothetical protein n=1 Tax=Endozoicomonas sp. ALB032 TaxID=3403082 RepID=UPI003BB6CE5F